MLPAIKALVIPHADHRYPTVGDWYTIHPGRLDFRVSAMGNEDYEFLVLLHELVEAYLCRRAGVPQAEVDAWDLGWEQTGREGEPGADLGAPYHKEHMVAEAIERHAAHLLEVDWDAYSAAVEALDEPEKELALGDSSSSE